ncbi:MAG: amidase [Rhodococcus erythropolis]|jgi:amidase|nr:amidase [Rhodococcus erythropolis]
MGIQVLARSHADLDLLQLAHGLGSVDTRSGEGLTRM